MHEEGGSRLHYEFSPSAPVSDARFLCRQTLLRDVLEDVVFRPSTSRSSVFIMRRRLGKTSLLLRIQRLIQRAMRGGDADEDHALDLIIDSVGGELDRERVFMVYADLSRGQDRPRSLALQVARGLRARGLDILAEVKEAVDPVATLTGYLEDLHMRQYFSLVLLLDEGSALVGETQDDQSVLSLQRAVRALTTLPQVPTKLLLAGTQSLLLRAGSELRAVLDATVMRFIGPLSSSEVDGMLSDSALAADLHLELRALCGCNPFLLHALGHAWCQPGLEWRYTVRAGIGSDLLHLSKAQLRWLHAAARDDRAAIDPWELEMLVSLGYIVRLGAHFRFAEGLLRQHLLDETHPTVELAQQAGPSWRLRPMGSPTVTRFGLLTLSGLPERSVGAQTAVMLHLLALARDGSAVATPLRAVDLCYLTHYMLSVAGMDHGVPKPEQVLATLRRQLRDARTSARACAPGEPPPDDPVPGRGGYRLHEVFQRIDSSLGRMLDGVDLGALLGRWKGGLRGLRSVQRRAVCGEGSCWLSLGVAPLAATHDSRFESALLLRVFSEGHVLQAELPPIPLLDRHVEELRYWANCVSEGRRMSERGWRAWMARQAPDEWGALSRLSLPELLIGLGLGGEDFEHGGRRVTTRWLHQLLWELPAASWMEIEFSWT